MTKWIGSLSLSTVVVCLQIIFQCIFVLKQELSNIPRLFDHNRIGFSEGEIGLSAFLPAVACLASDPLLLNRVLPNIKEQEYNTSSNYAGIVRFMLCRFGTWTEVIIDDSLPVSEGRPAGCQDQQNAVYWSSLLEKACAK